MKLNLKIVKAFGLIVFFLTLSIDSNAEAMSCHPGQSSYQCLVCNCYHESRGEPQEGKIAVAKTVLSRVESRGFPKTACKVIYQPWQFSWTRDRYSNRISVRNPIDRRSLQDCRDAADKAIDEGPNGLVYFFNPKVVYPAWARRVTPCGKEGNHLFLVPRGQMCPLRLGSNAKSESSPNINNETSVKSKEGSR